MDTNPVSWSVGELKAVEFDNADTLSLRDIYIIFRYVNENDYGDIPLAISAITPSGLRWTDTVLLRRGEGQQISNVMRDGETLYRHGVLLQEDGRYVFEFNPLREIEGIYSIGVYFYKKRESL